MTDLDLKLLYGLLGVIVVVYTYLSMSKRTRASFNSLIASGVDDLGIICVFVSLVFLVAIWPLILFEDTVKVFRGR